MTKKGKPTIVINDEGHSPNRNLLTLRSGQLDLSKIPGTLQDTIDMDDGFKDKLDSILNPKDSDCTDMVVYLDKPKRIKKLKPKVNTNEKNNRQEIVIDSDSDDDGIDDDNETNDLTDLMDVMPNGISDGQDENIIEVLKYEKYSLMTIKTDDGRYFKARDAGLILEYSNTAKAVQKHVRYQDKILLEELIKKVPLLQPSQKGMAYLDDFFEGKVNKSLLFLTLSGLLSLIMKSKQKDAIKFQNWVLDKVLPSVLIKGSYSISDDMNDGDVYEEFDDNQSMISHKYEPFYQDRMVNDYDNANVIYIGYIGVIDKEHLYKFGVTKDLYRREVKEHRKTFKRFDLVHVSKCNNKEIIEDKLKVELIASKLLRAKKINGKTQTELFATNDKYPLEKIKQTVSILIERHPLEVELERDQLLVRVEELENDKSQVITDFEKHICDLHNDINDLSHKLAFHDIDKLKNENKIKHLESLIDELTKMNHELILKTLPQK